MEFEGPFQGKSFLVVVDTYSKWSEAVAMDETPQTGQWMNCMLSLPGGDTAANGNR